MHDHSITIEDSHIQQWKKLSTRRLSRGRNANVNVPRIIL